MADYSWLGLVMLIFIAGMFVLAVAFRPGANEEDDGSYDYEPGEENLPDR